MRRTRLLEFSFGLAGKAGHHIGADRGGGHGGTDLFDLLAIVPGTIFAVHAAKHGIAAGLQRHVRVFGDARRRGHQFDQFVAPVHGFDRTDAEFLQRRFGQDGADQIFKSRPVVVGRWSLAILSRDFR